jgi:hypothetical protein
MWRVVLFVGTVLAVALLSVRVWRDSDTTAAIAHCVPSPPAVIPCDPNRSTYTSVRVYGTQDRDSATRRAASS